MPPRRASRDRPPALHRGLAVMVCYDPATLEEIASRLDLEELPFRRLGRRALVGPPGAIAELAERLATQGVHPRVVGGAPDPSEASDD